MPGQSEIVSSPRSWNERLKNIPPRLLSALLLFVILALFVTFNKLAFRSYFSDDDFSNMSMELFLPWRHFPKTLFTLALIPNVRPFGLLYYRILSSTAGYHFAAYVAVLQVLHVATALFLWLFLRRLGLRPLAAGLGCAFFALHMSILPAYWKPMYVFDVLCGFWVSLSLVLYQRERFFLSLLCAWLAFKSKEMELMLPVLLLLYEWQFGNTRSSGRRRWRPLIPFFLMSLSFGLQSLMIPNTEESAYTMHFTAGNLWRGSAYYGGKLLYAPLSGLIVSIGLLFSRVRVITFGVLAFWILMFPMLGFPARQSGAYIYVPLLGFAVATAGVAQWRPWWAALFLVLWIPASYGELRKERNLLLIYRYEHLPYVTQVLHSLATHPVPNAVIFEETPTDFQIWGQEGLFTYATAKHNLPVYSLNQPEALPALHRPGAVLYTWDWLHHRLLTDSFPGEGHELSYVDFGHENPVWQLKTGWKGRQGDCRWMAPRAVITLRQPAGDLAFALRVDLAPGQAEHVHQVLRVSSGGEIGAYSLTSSDTQTAIWPVASTTELVKDFEITIDPAYLPSPGSEPLGILVCACGFLPRGPVPAHASP